MKSAIKKYFPPLFLGSCVLQAHSSSFFDSGFYINESLISSETCSMIIENSSEFNSCPDQLIANLSKYEVFKIVLAKIFELTGFPHLIWSCSLSATHPDDFLDAHDWHFDNHYNVWTPKIMIYLNSQKEICGATDFIDSNSSQLISNEFDYMGLVPQRQNCRNKIDCKINDPCSSRLMVRLLFVDFRQILRVQLSGLSIAGCIVALLHV